MKPLNPIVGVLVGVVGVFAAVSFIGGITYGVFQAIGFAPFFIAGAWTTHSPRFFTASPDLERRYRVVERYMSMVAMLFLGFLTATILAICSSAGLGSGGWGIAQIVLFVLSIYVVVCTAIIKIGLDKRLRALHALNAKTFNGAGA